MFLPRHPDTFVEAEFEASHRPQWDREEEALNAYEDVALHDLAPVPMAEEAWEALLSHEARCAHEGDYDDFGRTS